MEKIFSGHSKSSGIYQILNKINNKRYFGQAKQLASRAYQHEAALKSNRHSNKHLQAAWNQYGPEAFEFSVLAVIDDAEKRTIAEQNLIDAFYGENCYNIEKKAQLMPEDVIEKISKALLGKPHSEASKEKMSEAKRGKKGKPHSEETKQKISEAGLGRTHSEATKQKMSEAKRGKTLSEEHKQKLSEAHLGQTPPNKGKPPSESTKQKLREVALGRTHSEETKQKMREAQQRRRDIEKKSV